MSGLFACCFSRKKDKTLKENKQDTVQPLRLAGASGGLKYTKTFGTKVVRPPRKLEQRSRTQVFVSEKKAINAYVFPREL